MRKDADVKTYRAWAHMKERCDNPLSPREHRYIGRGISYDPRWESYDEFLKDMGTAPEGLTLERLNNDGNYCKSNCSWATWEAQRKNKSIYHDNKSGVSGVHYCVTSNRWVARANGSFGRRQLYKGSDFFEAVCARKSWEVRV